MGTVLSIKASPRLGRSHSLAVAEAFLAAYREANPADEIVTLDLFAAELPPFDGLLVNAKYNILHGKPHPPEEAGQAHIHRLCPGRPVLARHSRGSL